jgi:hypothetical protein
MVSRYRTPLMRAIAESAARNHGLPALTAVTGALAISRPLLVSRAIRPSSTITWPALVSDRAHRRMLTSLALKSAVPNSGAPKSAALNSVSAMATSPPLYRLLQVCPWRGP